MIEIINLNIFATLLHCAYDLDILHVTIDSCNISCTEDSIITNQSCSILTNDGVVDIFIKHTTEFDETINEDVVTYYAQFKNNLRNVSTELLQDLIHGQLETEAFLTYENYKDIECVCVCLD